MVIGPGAAWFQLSGSGCPCTTPHDFRRFLGWCGNAGIRAFSRIIGKWRFL
ncbi:hypothetical protein BIFBIF_01117 [Bifidobacterium bifidum ATCC 29521 = JCM 1255 = DSM 20456]|nr:hypothetical protein BIFBIF_01117 [Bifidobacterium bifidum ATCC 29521 = JCM 1255 = DSM 20456]